MNIKCYNDLSEPGSCVASPSAHSEAILTPLSPDLCIAFGLSTLINMRHWGSHSGGEREVFSIRFKQGNAYECILLLS